LKEIQQLERMGPPNKFKQGLRKAALDAKIAANSHKIEMLKRSKTTDPNEESNRTSAPLSVQCGICQNLPSGEGDPVMPSGCDHLFCRQCLEPYLQRKKQCPVCHIEAAVFPRFDGPILSVLRALTFEMAGADLSTHLERGGECDAVHHNCGSNAATRDNPPLIRDGAEPITRSKSRSTPRIVARHGIPSPSASYMGWGSLPANPQPLVDPAEEFEDGCSVFSPCGKLVNLVKKGGWATKTAKELEVEKKEERMRRRLSKSQDVNDPFATLASSGPIWTKCTSVEWERAWVAARMTEDRARLRKAEVGRQKLQAKCGTPWLSRRDREAAYQQPKPREVKVKRRTGSPPWHSRGVTPSVFSTKPPKKPPPPLSTPAHLDSPLKDPLPQPIGSETRWADDALLPGGEEAPERPQTAPPELWRREIQDGRNGPPRLDESDEDDESWEPGGLLSDYRWATMGAAQETQGLGKTKGSRSGTPWSKITTMSTLKERTEVPTGSLASFKMMTSPSVASTTPTKHHSHGLRHTCSNATCTSKKTLFGPVSYVLPVPRARIPSRQDGVISGTKDQVLPSQPDLFRSKVIHSKTSHRQYMVQGVTPKPTSPQASPRSDFLQCVDEFEQKNQIL